MKFFAIIMQTTWIKNAASRSRLKSCTWIGRICFM